MPDTILDDQIITEIPFTQVKARFVASTSAQACAPGLETRAVYVLCTRDVAELLNRKLELSLLEDLRRSRKEPEVALRSELTEPKGFYDGQAHKGCSVFRMAFTHKQGARLPDVSVYLASVGAMSGWNLNGTTSPQALYIPPADIYFPVVHGTRSTLEQSILACTTHVDGKAYQMPVQNIEM